MHVTKVVDTAQDIHAILQSWTEACQVLGAAIQTRQTLAERGIEPLDKSGMIACLGGDMFIPPTSMLKDAYCSKACISLPKSASVSFLIEAAIIGSNKRIMPAVCMVNWYFRRVPPPSGLNV